MSVGGGLFDCALLSAPWSSVAQIPLDGFGSISWSLHTGGGGFSPPHPHY